MGPCHIATPAQTPNLNTACAMCSSEPIDKAPLRGGQGSIAAIGDGSTPEVLNDGSDRQNLTTGDGLSA
ncbi:MAG: hypothetical protein CL447_04340 [Acidimicrobiaceae bacterium]|nr:hypothetical protein [Acidimicrobiaceae bacterium]